MFEQRNLAQMKTVFPSAFVFRQEKGIPGTYADIREKEQYHLTIECGGVGEGKWLDSAALVERMQTFRNGLLLIITNHHKVKSFCSLRAVRLFHYYSHFSAVSEIKKHRYSRREGGALAS